MVGGVSPLCKWENGGSGGGSNLVIARGSVMGWLLSPDSPQMTVPTFGSGAHCSGTSRTAVCPCRSDSSMRRSGAGSG